MSTAKTTAASELQNARQWADVVVFELNHGNRDAAREAKGRAILCAKRAMAAAGSRAAAWAKDAACVANDYLWHADVDSITVDDWRALSSSP